MSSINLKSTARMGIFKQYGTPYTPKSFGMNDREFFLAVLRACPTGSALYLDQDERDSWLRRLADWSHNLPGRIDVQHYRIDEQFVAAVEQLLADEPSSLNDLHHVCVKAQDGTTLMASVDNFSIITVLDERIHRHLSVRENTVI